MHVEKRNNKGLVTPERVGKETIPRPQFHGMFVTPDSIGLLPHGEKAVATFNAGIVTIPNTKTEVFSHFAMYRVMTQGHIAGTSDKTAYFALQEFSLSDNGIEKKPPFFIDPKMLLLPEDSDLNPEDVRFAWDGRSGKVQVGLTNATDMQEPHVAKMEGIPVYKGDSIVSINFFPIQTAKEKGADGKPQRVMGKNVHVEFGQQGEEYHVYRPEYVDGKLNRTHFRTLQRGEDGLYTQVGEDGVYTVDPADVLPEGDTLFKFGLNGKTIPLPNGETLRVDHVCSVTPEGKYRYGFVTKYKDTIKPLLTYNDALALAGAKHEDLTGEKMVIYSNGSTVIPYTKADGSKGQRLLMAVTLFDKSIGMYSYDVDELAHYAREPLHVVSALGRRDCPAA